jgi:hypothetical protein
MRRTKVTQIYKKTGNLRAVQLLLGHTKMDSTVRYLGVELEDALAIAEAIEISRRGAVFTDGPEPTFIGCQILLCISNKAAVQKTFFGCLFSVLCWLMDSLAWNFFQMAYLESMATRCLIPRFDGAICSLEWKEALCPARQGYPAVVCSQTMRGRRFSSNSQ